MAKNPEMVQRILTPDRDFVRGKGLKDYLLRADKAELNEQDNSGNTLLHIVTKFFKRLVDESRLPELFVLDKAVLLISDHVDGRIRNKDGELAVLYVVQTEMAYPIGREFRYLVKNINTQMHVFNNILFSPSISEIPFS